MSPVYEYRCSGCRTDLELIQSYDSRDIPRCPSCGSQCVRRVSLSSWRMYNPFTKDGEGFTSNTYSPREADERVKYNLAKGDRL